MSEAAALRGATWMAGAFGASRAIEIVPAGALFLATWAGGASASTLVTMEAGLALASAVARIGIFAIALRGLARGTPEVPWVSWASPAIGDVVILRSPFDEIDIIKRIVALPGDTIAIEGNVIVRNGERVERRELGPVEADPDVRCIEETMDGRSWTVLQHDTPPYDHPEATVPEGHVFVLGDNRDRSNDSRNPRVGVIPFTRLKGLVLVHYVRAAARTRCP